MNKWIYSISTLILLLSACSNSPDSNRFDYLITNATIIDGTGSESYTGHILIKDGVIAKLGTFELSSILADEVIDAQDRVVSPGFIDPHRYAEGFDWVFVNGVEVVRNGVKNSALPGRVIRKN